MKRLYDVVQEVLGDAFGFDYLNRENILAAVGKLESHFPLLKESPEVQKALLRHLEEMRKIGEKEGPKGVPFFICDDPITEPPNEEALKKIATQILEKTIESPVGHKFVHNFDEGVFICEADNGDGTGIFSLVETKEDKAKRKRPDCRRYSFVVMKWVGRRLDWL